MTIHPLLKLAASQPNLLADHAQAYAALATEEVKNFSSAWFRRIVYYACAGMLAFLGLVFVGVALLIAAATAPEQRPAEWALLVVPLTPFVLAALCFVLARAKSMDTPFATLKAQVQADKALLTEIAAP